MNKWVVEVTVALAFVTLIAGLRAATLWWLSGQSNSNRPPPKNTEEMLDAIDRWATSTTWLNNRAAKWTAASAVLAAMTSVWSAMAPIFFGHQ